jgi:S-(hydroxymethyl)glutathione dehydrogenase/alcohol dehydrogenase
MATRAAVVDGPGQPPKLVDLDLAALRPDEVRVRLAATGVCHTDVAWADGEFFDVFPVVLGHESAGIVAEVGSAVRSVQPGTRVALGLAHSCGHCAYCESGRPMLCPRRTDAPPRLLRGGEPVVQGFGTGGFAEETIVRAGSVVPVPDGVPLTVAAVVGCAVSTGLGAVFNLAEVQYGTTVAVIGAGGIGLSVVLGCRVAGVDRIVVADPDPGRRAQALALGATDVVDGVEEEIRALAPGGFDYVFESAGRAEAMESAVRLAARGGTVTLMGVVPPGTTIRLDARAFVPSQVRLLGCLTGNVRPHLDFDRYFRLYLRGRLDLDALITSTVPIDDIETGFARCRGGEGIRTLVTFGAE